jgi:glycosyltransferase involved in cell wall biosynthesis
VTEPTPTRRVTFIAPFAEAPKATTSARIIPLARAVARRGYHVSVIVPPYDNPAEGGRDRVDGGVRVLTLDVPGTVAENSPWQAVAQPLLAARVARAALALRPDVVHVSKPKAVSGLAHAIIAGLRHLRGSASPAVVVDTDDWEGDGGWNEYETYPWWQRAVVNAQEWWGIGAADAVTTASRTLEAQAWSRGQPGSRTWYLPNGLDDADYPGWWTPGVADVPSAGDRTAARSRLGLADVPLVLLYTRFFEFAPPRALATIRAIRDRVPGANLLVVGAGKFGQERTLLELARASGDAIAITIAGWQAPADLPALLCAADMAVAFADDNLANRAKCSVKLLQLMRLGLPVVADATGEQSSYLGTTGDSVTDAPPGILVPAGDVAAMAEAGASLLRDPIRREAIGRAAARRARDHFGWDALAPAAIAAHDAALTRRDDTTRPSPRRA